MWSDRAGAAAARPQEDGGLDGTACEGSWRPLYIVLGALGIIGAFVTLLIFGGVAGVVGIAAHEEPDARIAIPIVGAIGISVFLFLLVVSLPGIIAGYGLLQFRPWARIAAWPR